MAWAIRRKRAFPEIVAKQPFVSAASLPIQRYGKQPLMMKSAGDFAPMDASPSVIVKTVEAGFFTAVP